MKRILIICVALVASAAILATGTATGGDDGTYEVRAVFDNAAFLVKGEEVRVAGAKVGTIADVTVSGVDEPVRSDGSSDPGKAVVVMRIDDPGFQDFRVDASCLIRPQSLIGEKFVECDPTEPRAAGSPAPPPLEQIPDGEPGEGQYLLPIENNGTAIDLDLVNNIMKAPYPDRFRLILNSLGASFAARGKDLAEIVQRSNPALRETNKVLAILAGQNRTLAKLSTDSDAVLTALARRRENIGSFINQSETVASATAERSADLEESFARFPAFLRELRSTMNRLNAFSTTATPVFRDLGVAAPSLARATEALGPFSEAATPAFTSLGDAVEKAGPDLISSDPVIRQVRGLGESGKKATKNLGKLLASLRKTGGFQYLNDFIFNSGGAINAFDNRGHFLRALLPNNNCVDYEIVPEAGCGTNFSQTVSAAKTAQALAKLVQGDAARELLRSRRHDRGRDRDPQHEPNQPGREGQATTEAGPRDGAGGQDAPDDGGSAAEPPAPAPTAPDAAGAGEPGVHTEPAPSQAGAPTPSQRRAGMGAARDLLEFLVGDTEADGRSKR